jgi:hypothetical protein
MYSQLSVDTAAASVKKGISDEGTEFLMPTEITVKIGRAEINGEIGRCSVSGGTDHWLFGISTEGHVAPRLELLAELHGEQNLENGAMLFLTVGARQKLTSTMIGMLAAGRTVQPIGDHVCPVFTAMAISVS